MGKQLVIAVKFEAGYIEAGSPSDFKVRTGREQWVKEWEFELPCERQKNPDDRWWIGTEGMGNFLCPPEHAAHYFSICSGKLNDPNSMSLEYPFEKPEQTTYVPEAVKAAARTLLKDMPGIVTDETWIKDVYRHLAKCYHAPDGDWQNPHYIWTPKRGYESYGALPGDLTKPPAVETYAPFVYIRKYDPKHQLREDLMPK